MTESQALEFAKKLIRANINEPLQFHINNLYNNKINYNKGKIRKLLYTIREEKYPKDDEFLKDIGNITIDLSKEDSDKEIFCIIKSQFINFNTKKTEKFVIFSSGFQLNMFSEICEIFIDGTFKICPKNWYQLVNVFEYNKIFLYAFSIYINEFKNF